jgi:glycosyltransferase 2 family protein
MAETMTSPSPRPVVEAEAAGSAEQARPLARRVGRRTALVVLGLAFSGLFGWLASREISLADLKQSLASADYVWLVPTVALTFVGGWVRAIRWRLLFTDPRSVTTGQSFGALTIGLMFNNLLPSRAGEVPRLLALRRATGLSAFEVGMTIVVERILDVFAIAITFLVIWPFLPERSWIHLLGLFCAGIVVGCLVLVALLALFRRRLPTMVLALLRKLPFVSEERAETVRGGLAAGARILLHPRRLAVAVALSFVVWGLVGLSGWTLLPAFDLEGVDALAPWLILVANTFALTIPSSSAAIGVYEASVQAALVAFGVSASTALSYALVLHAVNFFPIIAVGAIASWVMGSRPPHARFEGPAR